MKNRTLRILFDCMRRHRATIFVYAIVMLLNLVVFALYSLPIEPFLYVLVLTLFYGAIQLFFAYVRERRRADARRRLRDTLFADMELPEPKDMAESDYQEIVKLLDTKMREMTVRWENEKQDAEDYLTAWVHQIKTPISVLRMRLSSSDSEESHAVLSELFRIEQYVDMVLQYIRLSSATNDFVIGEYPLDEIIRAAVRRFAPQFVLRKLALHYEGTDKILVTDKKWLSCILDQLLSNAVKYTPSGSVTITVTDNALTIADTGIGIAPEDLPRIFEKGYTGLNGRLEKHASGLGLYLARTAADRLSMRLKAESTPGYGSAFTLQFSVEPLLSEGFPVKEEEPIRPAGGRFL